MKKVSALTKKYYNQLRTLREKIEEENPGSKKAGAIQRFFPLFCPKHPHERLLPALVDKPCPVMVVLCPACQETIFALPLIDDDNEYLEQAADGTPLLNVPRNLSEMTGFTDEQMADLSKQTIKKALKKVAESLDSPGIQEMTQGQMEILKKSVPWDLKIPDHFKIDPQNPSVLDFIKTIQRESPESTTTGFKKDDLKDEGGEKKPPEGRRWA